MLYKVALLVIASWCPSHLPKCQRWAEDLSESVSPAEAVTGVPAKLLLAVAYVESRGRPDARSLTDWGPFQLNTRSWWYQSAQACAEINPSRWVDCHAVNAALVLRRERRRCRNWRDALGAYNTGRCGGNPSYSRRVYRKWRTYRALR